MRMAHFIIRDAIIPELRATSRDNAIREMVDSLHEAGQLPNADRDDIVRAVLRRETLGTTGIGQNIVIPHSRHPSVGQLIGTIAITKQGVSFDSVDGEPVHVLVLLISPPDRPGDHLRALENVVHCFRDEALVKALKNATTRDEIWRLLDGGSEAAQ